MSREAEIRIKVQLDGAKVPRKIEWTATDAPFDGARFCDAVSVSIWDPQDRNTLSFDLWTSEMTVDEMNFFLLERLLKMAETSRRATQNPVVAGLLDEFGRRLTEHLEEAARVRSEEEENA